MLALFLGVLTFLVVRVLTLFVGVLTFLVVGMLTLFLVRVLTLFLGVLTFLAVFTFLVVGMLTLFVGMLVVVAMFAGERKWNRVDQGGNLEHIHTIGFSGFEHVLEPFFESEAVGNDQVGGLDRCDLLG